MQALGFVHAQSACNWTSLSSIISHACHVCRKIRVFKVTPGKTPQEEHPSFNPKHDYWYSQIHTTAHITNEDCYYDYSPWSELYKQAVAEGPAAVRQLRAVSPTTLIRGKDPQPDDNPKVSVAPIPLVSRPMRCPIT